MVVGIKSIYEFSSPPFLSSEAYALVDAKRRIYKDISLRDIREEKRFIEKLQGIMARDN